MGGYNNNLVYDTGSSKWVPELASGPSSTASHTTTPTTVGDSATSVTILAANSSRTMATIRNGSTAVLFLEKGATATTSSVIRLATNDIYELPILAGGDVYRGIITGIWESDAGGSAFIEETV